MGLLWGYDKKTCPECGMEIPSSARRCPYCHEEFGNNSLFDDIHQYGCLGLPVMGLIIFGCFWLIDKCSNPHIESSPTNNVGYSSSVSRTENNRYYSNSTLPKAFKYKVKVKRAPAYNSKGEILSGRFYDKGTIVEGYSTANGCFIMVVHSSDKRLNSSGVFLKLSDVRPLR